MFFLFHILVIILCFTELNSFCAGEKYETNKNRAKNSYKDASKNISTLFSTHKPMFEIIKNLTKSNSQNLKVNVFDRMLSEEIFSMRQHFHDKDMTHTTPVQPSLKIKACTPTLEVKQKWPILKLLGNANIINNKPTYKTEDEEKRSADNKINNNRDLKISREGKIKNINVIKDKIVGLRSLPEDLLHHEYNHSHSGLKSCSCLRTNPTTCSHRYTSCSQMCTHSKCTGNVHECTRTTVSYSIYSAIYLPYQPYIWTVTPQPYYYLDYLEKTKKPKHHHKTTKTHDYKDLYYESNENYYEDLDKGRKPHKHDEPKNIIINVDYIEKAEIDKSLKQELPSDNDKDKLVKDIENDLNTYYSDTVIKKCYCSSSSRTRTFFYLISFVTFGNIMLTK